MTEQSWAPVGVLSQMYKRETDSQNTFIRFEETTNVYHFYGVTSNDTHKKTQTFKPIIALFLIENTKQTNNGLPL